MSDIAISVRNVSKQYHIGAAQPEYRTFRDTLADAVTGPFRRAKQLFTGQTDSAAGLSESIWALKDISFDVKKGEVVGIIGRNGAGKSTLLKILSRITTPTTGEVRYKGRLGSLLEVGTGFHPELTGRENIYLNGAILGMTRAEINRKFDEIVDFSGVEKFLDTPVKHYSSGMGVRLAFAVAAHLEPEILVVDEVLAVGDAEFQKKSMGKMSEVASEGRTVLFVSHNMAAVHNLCKSGILLDEGSLQELGQVTDVVQSYLSVSTTTSAVILCKNHPGRRRPSTNIIERLRFLDNIGQETRSFGVGDNIQVEIELDSDTSTIYDSIDVSVAFFSQMGQLICKLATWTQDNNWSVQGKTIINCIWYRCNLSPGTYYINVGFSSCGNTIDYIDNAASMDIVFAEGFKKLPTGIIMPESKWSIAN